MFRKRSLEEFQRNYEAQLFDPMKAMTYGSSNGRQTAYVVPSMRPKACETFCTSLVYRRFANTEWDELIDPDGR